MPTTIPTTGGTHTLPAQETTPGGSSGISKVTLDLSSMTKVEGSEADAVTDVTSTTVTHDGSIRTNTMAKATRFEGVEIPVGTRMTINMKMASCPNGMGLTLGVGGGSNYCTMGIGKNTSGTAALFRATATGTKAFSAMSGATQANITLEVDEDGKMCRVTGTFLDSSGSFIDDQHQAVEVDPGTSLKLTSWVFYEVSGGSGDQEFDYTGTTYILSTLDGNEVPS